MLKITWAVQETKDTWVRKVWGKLNSSHQKVEHKRPLLAECHCMNLMLQKEQVLGHIQLTGSDLKHFTLWELLKAALSIWVTEAALCL